MSENSLCYNDTNKYILLMIIYRSLVPSVLPAKLIYYLYIKDIVYILSANERTVTSDESIFVRIYTCNGQKTATGSAMSLEKVYIIGEY